MSYRTAAWLAWSLVALAVAHLVGGIAPAQTTSPTDPGLPYDSAADAVFSLATWLPFSVASAISVIVRARHAGRVERQQIKWLAYGGAVVVGTIFSLRRHQHLERDG